MNLASLLKNDISLQELLNYYNATITYEHLPEKINGFVFSYDGIYNIFIDINLSYYKKRKTILHEIAHIELSHLNQIDKDICFLKVNKQEDEADKYIKYILNNLD